MMKKLRWYVVWNWDELWYVVASTSHSKAKVSVLHDNLWEMDKWEALQCNCQLVKQDLPIKATKEWELYPEDWNNDLIECGLFTSIEY